MDSSRPPTEADLAVVRATAADIAGRAAEPASLARTWSKIAVKQGGAPARPPRRWLRPLVPVGAAAAVLAVVLIAVAVRPGAPSPQTAGGQPMPTATGKPEPSVSAPGVLVPAPVTDLGTTLGPVPIGQVVSEMVARASSVAPVTLAAGQVLYLRFDTVAQASSGSPTVTTHEWWVDPDGWALLKNVVSGADMGPGDTGPAGLEHPSRQWLAGLSTEATVLHALLAGANAGAKNGGETYVLKTLSQLLQYSDPVLTPALRAGLFRVLGQLNGVTATRVTVAGRPLYRVHQNTAVFVTDLLLDPATGQVAGERWKNTDGATTTETIDLWYHAVVDHIGVRP